MHPRLLNGPRFQKPTSPPPIAPSGSERDLLSCVGTMSLHDKLESWECVTPPSRAASITFKEASTGPPSPAASVAMSDSSHGESVRESVLAVWAVIMISIGLFMIVFYSRHFH